MTVHCPTCLGAYRTEGARCPRDGTALVGAPDPMLGATIAGRYRVEALLGEGGMGRVYRVRHVGLDKVFALKAVFGDLAADPCNGARFEREARAASRLDHPNIVATIDFSSTPEGLLYLVLEYLEGPDLASVLARERRLPAARALAIFRQLLDGLAHAHGRGLVHRDLKPENLLLVPRDDGEPLVKIVDFGLARLDRGEPRDRVTRAGEVCGTPDYMAPEQVRALDVTSRADLYAAGIILYQMLAGRTPFHSESPADTMIRQCTLAPAPLHSLVGDGVPPAVFGLVDRLLRKDPAERPASAVAVIEAIWGPGARAPTPPPVSPPAPTAREGQTSPTLALCGVRASRDSQPPAVAYTRVTPAPVVPATARRWIGAALAGAALAAAGVAIVPWPARAPAGAAGGADAPAVVAAAGPAMSADSASAAAAPGMAPAADPESTTPPGLPGAPAPPSASPAAPPSASPSAGSASRERFFRRAPALIASHGLSRADVALDRRIESAWHAASIDDLVSALAAFDYPRAALKRKIERVSGQVSRSGSAGAALGARLDAEVARLPGVVATRDGRRDLWTSISAIERDVRRVQ